MWLTFVAFLSLVAFGLLASANLLTLLTLGLGRQRRPLAGTALATTGIALTLLAYATQHALLDTDPELAFVATLCLAAVADWSLYLYYGPPRSPVPLERRLPGRYWSRES